MKAATRIERTRPTRPPARPRPRRRPRPMRWVEPDDGPDPVIQELIARAARGETFRVQVF